MEQLLIKSLIISLFCVGLRIASSPGMVLYFLRKPFENLEGWKNYLAKPVILCSTCMASVWTIVIEYAYFELSIWTILIIFVVAAMNSIIYAFYEILT